MRRATSISVSRLDISDRAAHAPLWLAGNPKLSGTRNVHHRWGNHSHHNIRLADSGRDLSARVSPHFVRAITKLDACRRSGTRPATHRRSPHLQCRMLRGCDQKETFLLAAPGALGCLLDAALFPRRGTRGMNGSGPNSEKLRELLWQNGTRIQGLPHRSQRLRACLWELARRVRSAVAECGSTLPHCPS